MNELRTIETNAADDSAGRAFGLEGNLYLVLVVAALGTLALYAVLALLLDFAPLLSGLLAGIPLAATAGWAIGLRHGKPSGYDRDWLDQKVGGGSFARSVLEQKGLT